MDPLRLASTCSSAPMESGPQSARKCGTRRLRVLAPAPTQVPIPSLPLPSSSLSSPSLPFPPFPPLLDAVGYTLFAAESVMDPKDGFFAKEGYFDAGYKVYIGPGKYFVTSDVGSGRIQWYAFLALPPGTKARESNLAFLKEQFDGWTNEIHACLENTPEGIIEQRDLYDRRPSVLKSWSKGHVTMLGDAVHPVEDINFSFLMNSLSFLSLYSFLHSLLFSPPSPAR